MRDVLTTILELLGCLLLAAGLAVIVATAIGGAVGVGVGLIVAAVPPVGLSMWASR